MVQKRPTEDEIFRIAYELPSPDARIAYLKQVCRDEVEVERMIAMLKEGSPEESFLEKGPPELAETAERSAGPDMSGESIGPYKLLQAIGEGGFGVVYLAEQVSPVRRKVALKVIKPGMDTKQVIARFEAERQALALMDHPNVARVFDGGSTEEGRPYFVMELVKGVPITTFCNENKLNVSKRLELFATVCKAIQHAHQKGVIHRDIKPSNVMVTLHDGKPVPKVIDFGVAKAMSQQLTEKTMFTAHGQMIGTVQYMSPEQAEMSGLDIDTRSDIYSLGILLYELLTGGTPLDPKQIQRTAYAEMVRLIREQESPKPSTRVSTLGDRLSIIADQRGTDAQRLGQFLRGDLDWIVMRAIEKDRTRRYETASSFAADVERFLSDEPVDACPPSLTYKLSKFTRRNRGPVTAGVAIAVTLCLGIFGTTLGMIRANRHASALRAEVNFSAQQTKKAQRAEADETLAKMRLEEQSYFQLIRLAEQAMDDGRPAEALRFLEQCPSREGDQWEWNYLHRLACSNRPDFRQVELPGNVRTCAWSTVNADTAVVLTDDGSLTKVTLTNDRIKSDFIRKVNMKEWTKRLLRPPPQLAFSPSDARVSVVSREGFQTIDTISGEIVLQRDGDFIALAIHPDPTQKRLATATKAGLIQIWNSDSGELLDELHQPSNFCFNISYSPDGRRLAATGEYHISIWSAETGELEQKLAGHNGPAYCLSFSNDSRFLASGGIDQKVNVWDVNQGELHKELIGHTAIISGLSFGSNRLASADREGNFKLWHVESSHETLQTKPLSSDLATPVFGPDGTRLIATSNGNNLNIWDATPNASQTMPTSSFEEHGRIFDVAFLRDNNLVGSQGENGFHIWDLRTGQQRMIEDHGPMTFRIAVHPNGRTVLSGQTQPFGSNQSLQSWDFRPDGTVKRTDAFAKPQVFSVAIGPNGRWIASGGRDGDLCVWDENAVIAESAPIQLGSFAEPIYDVEFSPCGRYLAANLVSEIWIWNTGEKMIHEEGRRLAHSNFDYSWHLAFSPDGEHLACGDDAGNIVVFPTSDDQEDGLPSESWQASEEPVWCVAYSPDGQHIASAGSDETIRIWDVGQKKHVATFLEGSKVFCLDYSSDGGLLASGSHGKQIKVWDTSDLIRNDNLPTDP